MQRTARLARRRWRARNKTGGGVPPGPAGIVLVSTLFWKILVTRVNGKMRGAQAGFWRCGGKCFCRATIANIFRARRLSGPLAALAREALRIVSDRRERLWGRNGDERIGCAARLLVAPPGRRDRCDGACARSAARAG